MIELGIEKKGVSGKEGFEKINKLWPDVVLLGNAIPILKL